MCDFFFFVSLDCRLQKQAFVRKVNAPRVTSGLNVLYSGKTGRQVCRILVTWQLAGRRPEGICTAGGTCPYSSPELCGGQRLSRFGGWLVRAGTPEARVEVVEVASAGGSMQEAHLFPRRLGKGCRLCWVAQRCFYIITFPPHYYTISR